MAASESKSNQKSDERPAAEAMTGEQEEALQKIMAELETEASSAKSAAHGPTVENEKTPSDTLTSEQEAALQKIMAEIEGRDGSSAPSPTAPVENPPTGLDNDQEVTLNKIIAELQNTSPPNGANDPAEGKNDPSAEELSSEQEDALKKIMADIEGQQPGEQPNQKIAAKAPGQKDEAQALTPAPRKNKLALADVAASKHDPPSPIPSRGLSTEDFESELQKVVAQANSSEAMEPAVVPPLKKSAAASLASSDLRHGNDEDTPEPMPPSESPPIEQKTNPPPEPIGAPSMPAPADALPAKPMGDAGPAAGSTPSESPASAPAPKINTPALSPARPSAKVSKTTGRAAMGKGLKLKKRYWLLAAAGVFMILVLGMVGINRHRQPPATPGSNLECPADQDQSHPPVENQLETAPQPPAAPAALDGIIPSDAERLTLISQDIGGLRNALLNKQKEIEELKDAYRQGIAEVQGEISAILRDQNQLTYAKALEDPRIELGLRTILRRQDYIIKLDIPYAQLVEASEELLYLQRKVDILHQMLADTSGIGLDAFEKQVTETMGRIGLAKEQLSIDEVALPPRSLEALWNAVVSEASRPNTGGKENKQRPVQEKANQQIGSEVCAGKFERKYELSELTEETARCLVQWNGKDLYLNRLRQLTPEAAKILSQWKGEWLGLNGLSSLSPEAARYLSLWKGKYLSLNGLRELSPRSTQYLSKWSGEQIEMINLKHIGQWDNPKIKLYVSDKLRAQIPD
jgi:hypothetical protein